MMTSMYSSHFGVGILCIILVGILCVSPIYAAEMTDAQITEQLDNFFTNEGASAPSSDELRTLGILFIMTADLKDGFDSGEKNQISDVLNPDTYACVGADAKTDYFSKLFIFLKLLESGNDRSFTDLNFGNLLIVLGMRDEKTVATQPTSSSTDLKKEVSPNAQIKAGLNIPEDPEKYSQYNSSPIASTGTGYTGYSYEGGMNP